MKKILTIMALLVAFVTTGFADDTWTVAGSNAAILGVGWAPSETANDMTLTDGIYLLEKELDTPLAEETYLEYKVVKNHAWGTQYPSSNASATFAAGTSKILFMFKNDDSHGVDVVTTVCLKGSWNGWRDGLVLTRGQGLVWSEELDLSNETGDVEFKLLTNVNSWYGTESLIIDAPNGWVGNASEGTNVVLKNSTTGYKTYTITASWDGAWKVKIEGKDERIAEITSVKLMGTFDNWNDGIALTQGTGYSYTGTIPVSANGETFCLKVNEDTWVKYGENAATLAEDYDFVTTNNDNNFVLSGDYESYAITATWTPSPDESAGWTLTLVPGELRIAEIASVAIKGALASDTQWANAQTIPLTTNTPNVYSQVVPLTTTLEDFVFGLVVNGEFINFNKVTIDPSSADLLVDDGTNNHNILFKNSTSGYDIYLATATWTPGPDATKGWTLKVVGTRERVLVYGLVGDLTGGKPESDDDQTKDVVMTKLENGLYTYEVESFEATQNTNYEFKLRTNKIWGLFDLPKDDYNVWTPTESGNYKLTFVANVTGAAITDDTFGEIPAYTVTVVPEKIIVPITAYYIVTKGDNNVWTTKAQMTENEGVFTYTFTGKYNQGVIFNIVPNTALNNDLTQVDTWDDVYVPVSSGNYWVEFKDYPEISLEKTSNIVGFIFKASGATTTITYNPAQNVDKIAITNTAEATVSEAGYATYSNSWDYKVVGNGLKVYVVKGVADGEADMVELAAGAGIPAYTGVVIEADAGSYTVTPAEEATADVTGNLLVGSGDYVYGISGDFGQGANPRYYTAYILAKKGTDVGFYKFDSSDGIVLDPHKAFLAVPKNGDSDAPAFIGFGDTTGIVNVNRATITNNQYYTLDGRRVENPTKGLYIVNGKKVVIK